MPQTGAQHARKRQVDLVVDLHLRQSSQAVFHRVFDGDHLQLGGIDLGQRRVQRGGFARTGRPGHQHHARGAVEHLTKTLEQVRWHTNVIKLFHARALLEQTHHDRFAVIGGQRRQPHVDGDVTQAHAEAAVLRQTLL